MTTLHPSSGCTARAIVLVLGFTSAASPAGARTIILDASHCDQMAAIAEAAPLQSWVMNERASGIFDTARVQIGPDRSFLFRFPLGKIPAGQRIAHAELVLPVVDFAGSEPRFYLWRMASPWGAGVSYIYRTQAPQSRKWVEPGARGHSSDRATRPSEIVRLTEKKEVTVNVTEDVAIWYARVADNSGWMVSVEDPGVVVYLAPPLWEGSQQAWKLRITYEPR